MLDRDYTLERTLRISINKIDVKKRGKVKAERGKVKGKS